MDGSPARRGPATPAITSRLAAILLLLVFAPGCGDSSPPATAASDEAPTTDAAPAAEDDGPFVLGDLIEPFTPPATVEQLLAAGEWSDGQVTTGMDLLRAELEAAGPPPLSVEEALELRNDSPEENAKIVGTLGRLPPQAESEVDDNATLVRCSSGDVNTFNPIQYSTESDIRYLMLTQIALFTFDRHFNFFADANHVQSWRSRADGKADVVVMRDDLTWSDGAPITAYDVVFAFRAIMSSKVAIPALRTNVQQLAWVEAYDDHTVAFFHKESLATNLLNMNFPLIPKHAYEDSIAEDPTLATSDYHRKLEDEPITGGPYELVSRTRGQEYVTRRRESYYVHNGEQVRDKPHYAEVRVRIIEDLNTALLALKAGRVDEHRVLPDQWISLNDDENFHQRNVRASGVTWTKYYIVWNQQTPYFEDKRVRWAMSYAIDYENILDRLFFGIFTPARGEFHPSSWMFPRDAPEPLSRDLDRAEDLLDEAGWTDTDGDGVRDKMIDGRRVPFRFTLMCHQYAILVRLNTAIKENLEQIGVECILKPTEFTVAVEKTRSKEFQAYQGVWGTGSDPSTTESLHMTGEPRNYASYSNPEVDRLFVEARRELDREKRGELYGRIHNLLWEDQVYTYLLYRNEFYGFSKKLRGYNFSPRGPYSYGPGLNALFTAKPL